MKIVFIPALIVVLIDKEQDIGRELTRDEVESIRDGATAVRLPAEAAEIYSESVATAILILRMSGASGRRIKLTECRWEHTALVAHENCALTRMRLLNTWCGAEGQL